MLLPRSVLFDRNDCLDKLLGLLNLQESYLELSGINGLEQSLHLELFLLDLFEIIGLDKYYIWIDFTGQVIIAGNRCRHGTLSRIRCFWMSPTENLCYDADQ